MTQNFSFDTNIEKRMPDTGKVFFVDRMTSDYAVAHPFDLDGYLEEVYSNFAGTEFEESRDAMRRVWTAVLSVKSQRGDASLYPNKNGEKHPALMQVWGKAGDYWRRGFRIDDVLPAIVPICKITRLDNGEWIALFPKDLHLLDAQPLPAPEVVRPEPSPTPSEPKPAGQEPVQLDLFAQMQMEVDRLREENEKLHRVVQTTESTVTPAHPPAPRRKADDAQHTSFMEQKEERKRRQQEQADRAYARLYGSPAITVRHDHSERNSKIFAVVATATIFVALLNTIGIFGIAAIGLIAGGVVK